MDEGDGCNETSVLGDVRMYVRKYMHGENERGGGRQEGGLYVLLPSRKGLQETTDFVAPATSDVRRPHEVVNTDGDL